MIIDFSKISKSDAYKIMSNTITPRPIAWISTELAGVSNLAPFSYFAPLSSKPPIVVVSIGKKSDGTKKDTLQNLLNGSKATINFVDISMMDEMSETAKELPKNQSEFDAFNILPKKILEGYPPIADGALAAIFCDFVKEIDLGGDTTPILLEIKKAYYDESVINEKFHINLENIGRVGMKFLVGGELLT